jgi:hypothetical protein
MSPRWAIWLLPLALALHNVEEAATMPAALPGLAARLSPDLRQLAGSLSPGAIWLALALATAVPLAVSVWADRRPGQPAARWLVLALWATVLLNTAWHGAAALLVFHGYAPGVLSAVLVNLPLSVLALGSGLRGGWVSRPAAWALVPAALGLHTLGTAGLLGLARLLVGAP